MSGGRGTVLVVDDDEDIRESFSDVLQDEGFEVAACENGLAALHYLTSSATLPCIIVLDLMMPIMSGAEFREKQLAEPRLRDVPVIVMSAADRGSQIAAELRAGGFIAKPARVEQLLNAIARLC